MVFNKKIFFLNILISALISLFILCAMSFSLFMFFHSAVFAGIASGVCSILFFLYTTARYRKRKKISTLSFPAEWEGILNTRVFFYNSLSPEDKVRFKEQIKFFIHETAITGIKTEVDDTIKVLVAASAVIPVFGYPRWEYGNLSEVLIYPSSFNEDYEFGKGKDANILGLVTNGGSTMVLSRTSLMGGFNNENDKLNVGFHEFAHKIDQADGAIDGIPGLFISDKKTVAKWLDVAREEAEAIKAGKSDINPYALTNNAEFFAVVTEYFFENPSVMESKHPELYGLLKKIYKQDTLSAFSQVVKNMFVPRGRKIGRNAKCPCGSGKKYKKCCGA